MPRKARPVVYSSSSSEEDVDTNQDEGSEESFESVGELSNLFDRLKTYIAATDRNPSKIFKDLKKHQAGLNKAMFSALADKKENDLAAILDVRAEEVKKLNNCSEKLDNMLFDCLAGAELGPPSPEPGEPEPANDGEYKYQLQAIKIKHTKMLEELEQSRSQTERLVDNMVEMQILFRPISKEDHRRMIETSNSRYSCAEEAIKKSTVNAVMLINNKCLDARRRRRNFTKETTDVLTRWFHDNIEHPYPTDAEKNELAIECNITVQQITNWFGNRRVRQKRQADRPLQPPSSPKKKEGHHQGSKNMNHLKGNRARAAQRRGDEVQQPDVGQRQQHIVQQQLLQLQQAHAAAMLDQNNYQVDQFEPQGIPHPSTLLIPEHYQLNAMDHSLMDDQSMAGSQDVNYILQPRSSLCEKLFITCIRSKRTPLVEQDIKSEVQNFVRRNRKSKIANQVWYNSSEIFARDNG
ncbi:hypothetical protein PENTCL1PPCAC_29230 [Pristionchus entomophagus]|uniref:Homeobox domain-containing protein n=1 Tax=Pristionchus entomophagus TaxID=358040 RepID=A0AAV5UKV9_9BILA|nr:hypothetical protein PENTCL1PPCAC_29230 [Pristionchus entomophagus]